MNAKLQTTLTESGWVLSVPAGQVVIQQEVASGFAYYVVHGHLEAYRNGDGNPPRILGLIGPEEWFGEISSLFVGGNSSANVRARDDCTLYEVSAPRLSQFMDADPELACELLDSLASGLRGRITGAGLREAAWSLQNHCTELARIVSRQARC